LKTKTEVQVGKRLMTFSNLEKIFYPQTGFTKGQMIDYYSRVSSALLPHMKNRPLTLKRYPDGVEGFFFYEKNCPSHKPEWIKTVPIWSDEKNANTEYCVANDLPSLLWAVNLGSLELHTSLSLGKEIMRPTVVAFDLDPGAPANVIDCCDVALWLRRIFDELGMESFPKTSGSKGLQIYVPLNTATSYDETKPFAQALAQMLEAQHPDRVVSKMKKELRRGRVFVDWSQNDNHKTTVCVYSMRAKPRPTVSTPLQWKEVESAVKKRDPEMLEFETDAVLKRVEKYGDLFEPVLKLKQKVPVGALAR